MSRRVKRKRTRECPGCKELKKELAKVRRELKEALQVIEELKGRLGMTSRNSSRPPSSDPPDAPPRPEKAPTGRKRGGQPGHQGKRRDLLPTQEVDEVVEHKPSSCDNCGAELPEDAGPDDPPPTRHQVVDLPEKPYRVTEHQAHTRTCEICGEATCAEIPRELAGSSFGPALAAVVTMLTGVLNVSRRGAEEFVRDALGVPIALGSISNVEAEMSEALVDAHEQAREKVRHAPAKNVDETGWKRAGKKCWLWVAATVEVAFFVIHQRRGKQGLVALLGEKLKGIFTTDRWGAYGEIKSRCRQLCWSHLLRDFQKVIDRGGKGAKIGEKGLEIANQVFWLWKDFRAKLISRQTLQKCLRPLKKELRDVLSEGARLRVAKVPVFCENLLALEPALWTFARQEGVEPTNNHAERVLRRGVLWRKRAFGANSERGCRFVERILTAVQSRRLQKRPVLKFLIETLKAHRAGTPKPSLVSS